MTLRTHLASHNMLGHLDGTDPEPISYVADTSRSFTITSMSSRDMEWCHIDCSICSYVMGLIDHSLHSHIADYNVALSGSPFYSVQWHLGVLVVEYHTNC